MNGKCEKSVRLSVNRCWKAIAKCEVECESLCEQRCERGCERECERGCEQYGSFNRILFISCYVLMRSSSFPFKIS